MIIISFNLNLNKEAQEVIFSRTDKIVSLRNLFQQHIRQLPE